MAIKPLRFIGESITVGFEHPPFLEKKPTCPDWFIWVGQTYQVTERLSEWVDTHRRGRMARNMQPQHAEVAERRGSWGVGRYFFQVRTVTGQLFELYYDRAPRDADSRKGEWFLVAELIE